MRITKGILQKKFEHLCKALGKTVGYQPGEWSLDYASSYGGYIVVENLERGGENHPLVNTRMNAENMSNCLDFAIRTIYLVETK